MTPNQHRALAAELAAMHKKLADLSGSLPASATMAKKNATDAAKNVGRLRRSLMWLGMHAFPDRITEATYFPPGSVDGKPEPRVTRSP